MGGLAGTGSLHRDPATYLIDAVAASPLPRCGPCRHQLPTHSAAPAPAAAAARPGVAAAPQPTGGSLWPTEWWPYQAGQPAGDCRAATRL